MKQLHFFGLPVLAWALALIMALSGCRNSDSSPGDNGEFDGDPVFEGVVIPAADAIRIQEDLKASDITEISEGWLSFKIGYNTGKSKVSYAANTFTGTLKSDFSTVVDTSSTAWPIVNEWSSGKFTWLSVDLDEIVSALRLEPDAGNYKIRQKNKAFGIYFDSAQDERISFDGDTYIKEFSLLAHNGTEFIANNPFNVMLGEEADTITLDLLNDDEATLLFTISIIKPELAIDTPPMGAVRNLINANAANNPNNDGGLIVMAGDGEVGHTVAVSGPNKLTVTFDRETVSPVSRDRLLPFSNDVNELPWISAMENPKLEWNGLELSYFEWVVLYNYNFAGNPTLWKDNGGAGPDRADITDYVFIYIDLYEIVKTLNINNKESVYITPWCPAYIDVYPDQDWTSAHDLAVDKTSTTAREIASFDFEYVYLTKATDGDPVRFKITFEDDSNEYLIDLDASSISYN